MGGSDGVNAPATWWRRCLGSAAAPWSVTVRLFVFLVPLILVTGFASVHDWAFVSYSTGLWSSAMPPSPPSDAALSPLTETEGQKLAEPAVQKLREDAQVAPAILNKSVDVAVVPSTNQTRSILATARVVQREHTKLERLEAGLHRARAAILQVRTRDTNQSRGGGDDYVPVGPMYWNADAFHRSYLEMERQFKVFVYEEGEPPVFHNGPCKSIYSMEGSFIHEMEMSSQFRTSDPQSAHVFFLPFSVAMLVHFVHPHGSHDFAPIKHTVSDYIRVLARKYPFWNRSLGADHFMLACHDWGPETSRSVPRLHKNAIRALCNANTSEGFIPAKDVSFPEVNLPTGTTRSLIGGPSPSHRSILAFFAGGLHGPIRPLLLNQWENKDKDLRVHRYLPKGVSYYDVMRSSRYCLCPSGYEVASPRIVEALYTGCVPVLISDGYVPPFSDVLNWNAFSVEVPVAEIPNLKTILMGISGRQYVRLQRRGAQVRKHFEVNSPPRRMDAFHMILHSVWLRRLNVRVRDLAAEQA